MLDRRSYRSTAYAKTALALLTIDRTLGGHRLRDALGEYFRAWRFRHPSGRDFRALVDEQVEEDLAPLFAQLFDDTAIARLRRRADRRPRGAAAAPGGAGRRPAERRRRSRRATAPRW